MSREQPNEQRPSASTPDIARLTSQMAKQDESAYCQFHELYCARLFRYLLVVTAGREDAARDALQSTLLRVVRHARRFDSEDVFWSWLTVLARSSLVDAERKHSRYRALLERFIRHEPPAPPSPDPDANADGRLLDLLEQNLTRLPPEDRVMLEQKYFNGDSVREIAAATGATEKSVESRLVRIRRQLRDFILAGLKHEP